MQKQLALFFSMLSLILASVGCGQQETTGLQNGMALQAPMYAVKGDLKENYIKRSKDNIFERIEALCEEYTSDFLLASTAPGSLDALKVKSLPYILTILKR